MKTKIQRVTSTRLVLLAWHDHETDVWVGYCPALDMYSQGTSEEEAYQAIDSGVTLWLSHAEPRRIAALGFQVVASLRDLAPPPKKTYTVIFSCGHFEATSAKEAAEQARENGCSVAAVIEGKIEDAT